MAGKKKKTNNSALDSNSKKKKELLEKVLKYYELDRLNEVIDACNQIIEITPNDANAHNLLGLVGIRQKQYDIAIKHIQQAIASSPNIASFHYNLALALKGKKKYQLAISEAQKAIKFSQDCVEYLVELGILYEKTNLHNKAIDTYKDVIKINPDCFTALNNLGCILAEKGEIWHAILHFERLLEISPQNKAVLYNLGTFSLEVAKYNDAIKYFEKLLPQEQSSTKIILQYAKSLYYNQELDKAQHYLASINISELKPIDKVLRCGLLAKISKIFGNWKVYDANRHTIVETLKHMQPTDIEKSINPEDAIDLHLPKSIYADVAQSFTTYALKLPNDGINNNQIFKNDDKINIAYIIPNQNHHDKNIIILNIIKQHDTSKHNVHILSFDKYEKSDLSFDNKKIIWHNVSKLNDVLITDAIKQYQINILIDCGGYCKNSKANLLLTRNAPCQISWLGFDRNSYIENLDYILVDNKFAKENSNLQDNLVILESTDLAFEPYLNNETKKNIPLNDEGKIIFYNFDDWENFNQNTINTWHKILVDIPDSILVLKNFNKLVNAKFIENFANKKINVNRFKFVDIKSLINNDISPPNGIYLDIVNKYRVENCNNLLMLARGIPVISINNYLIEQLDINSIIVSNIEEYINLAKRFADKDFLKEVTKQLIAAHNNNILFNNKAFVANLEKAYELIWYNYKQQIEDSRLIV